MSGDSIRAMMIPPFFGYVPGWLIAFAALVEGKVLGIPAGTSNGQVCFLGKGNRVIAEHLLRPFKPGLVRIAADKSADLAPFIDEGVQQEIRPAEFHAFQHILMDGIVRQGPALRKGIDAFPRGI